MTLPNKVDMAVVAVSFFFLSHAFSDVRINEFSALSSDRLLQWSDSGLPRVGAGKPWWEADFDDTKWPDSPAPLGFNYGTIATNLSPLMEGKATSLYLRQTFTVSAADAASVEDLLLDIDYDDGFIAYLNGVEIARANMGAKHGFCYADQPSLNSHPWTGNETFNLGQISDLLQEGENIIAIQLHNSSLGSNNLYLDAGLKKTAGGLVNFVSKGSSWNYFIGLVEPSGGVFDPTFLPDAEPYEPEWARVDFLDGTWDTGAGPLGFDSATHYPLGTDLDSMRNNQSVLYTRKTFFLSPTQLTSISTVDLTVDFDDGFVAFLNGKEIARSNLGTSDVFVPFDATAPAGHNASMDSGGSNPAAIETFAIDKALLTEGDNVLAIQMVNSSPGSSDLMVIADLTTNGGSGPVLVANDEIHKYFIGTEEPSPVEDNSEATVEPKFVDWIELHNDGPSAVDLTGWSLTDDEDEPQAWLFPSGTQIEAGGYLLVLASGLEPAPGSTDFLHANFKLSANGEYLGLYDNTGAVVTEFDSEYPKQYDFHSYGTDPGGGGSYGFLSEPTPGAANEGPFLSGRAKSPDFSTEGGFHSGTVPLSLTSETTGATIRYTTDGTVPTLANGTVYSTALSLTPIDDKTGHVIRARSFAPGMIPSKVKTHTFLINQNPNLASTPALIFTGDEDRSLYKKHGILAIEGGTYVNNRWQADGINSYNIPINRGQQWERPVHLELHYPDGRESLSEDAGIRVSSSNYSRPRLRLDNPGSSPWPSNSTQKPSFNLYFRGDYGADEIDFPWVSDEYPVDKFRQLRVRAGKNDIKNPFIADEVVRRLYSDMGQASSNGIINSVYINGELKGFFNMTERLREPFFQEHHDSNEEWDVRQVSDFANGDSAKWNEMVNLSNQNLAVLANYQALQGMLDVDNFIDYLILNTYGCTWDWPQNNWVAARERSDEGLWRFYVWDAEGAIGRNRNPSYDTLQTDLINKNNDIPRLYKRLRTSPEFLLRWADRVQKHFFNGGALDDSNASESNLSKHWTELAAEFGPLLSYLHGETVNNSRLGQWTSPTTGKRTYLFGPNATQFRNHGLWPDLRPPAFSQHGGEVPGGFNLTMTHNGPNGSQIYVTTDGTDPRLPGGAVAPTASLYSNGVALYNASTTVKARVFNPNNSEWSAVNEATFSVGISPVYINEILTHTDLPEIDSIELYNPNPVPIDLRGWYLTDDESTPKKFQIPPGTTIPAGGYLVFDEDDFFTGPEAFRLSEYGEDVFLFSSNFTGELTGYSHGFHFRAAPNGVSFGRYTDSQGKVHFVLQDSKTLGSENSDPLTGPVVISEIHYRPPDFPGDVDNDIDEFIELTNISIDTVPLYGTDTSVPGYGNNALNDTWRLRNAVDYDFPVGTELAPTERILVVGFDPENNPAQLADFRTKFNVPGNIRVFGPWSGKLDNSGEEIELKYPGSADSSLSFFVPYYTMEEIDYRDSAPWPPEADGLGSSLQRIDLFGFANDPQNWQSGPPQEFPLRDSDGDQIDDLWELLNGLTVGVNDGDLDPDLDGHSNLEEFRARTSPHDPASFLKLDVDESPGGLTLRFVALTGVAYTIQETDSIIPPVVWNNLEEIDPPTQDTEMTVAVIPTGQRRFYRLIITPAE